MQDNTGLYLCLGLIIAGIPSGLIGAIWEFWAVKRMAVDNWMECNEAQKKGAITYAGLSVVVYIACTAYWLVIGHKGPMGPWSMSIGTAWLIGSALGLAIMALVAWPLTHWVAKNRGYNC